MSAQKAVGIDLGTTFSAVAVVNQAGKPEIVPNSDGERITASAVLFQKVGPLVVGNEAVNAAGGAPGRVARWVKREMGSAEWEFAVDDEKHSAVDVSSLILLKLKKDAEQVLGAVPAAVVTVPAYFDEVRRKATMDAAEKAGFEVLRIINEPTAAALAYAASGRLSGRVLVYDLGGGTFDVSIVDVSSSKDVKVVASGGDHRLGGHDFDVKLAEHFDAKFKEETGLHLKDDPLAWHEALQEAERVKKTLSKLESSPASLRREGRSVGLTVSRLEFDRLTRDLIARTEMLVENALAEAGLSEADIDAVVLVGGSTRLAAVQTLLRTKFGREPLRNVNPDEAVALGAAIQAAMILAERGQSDLPPEAVSEVTGIALKDVTSHSYGVAALRGDLSGLYNNIMIPKNTPIPASNSELFSTTHEGQTSVGIEITQGEGEDLEFVRVIAKDDLDLPAGRPANMEIRATYSYDANGRMSCEFVDIQSGRRKVVDLDTAMAGAGVTGAAVPTLDDIDFSDIEIV
jgi:molecular chaperone DnaK